MAALLIKSIPTEIHERLRFQATRYHRSMNGGLLAILEEVLEVPLIPELPPAVKPLRPVSGETIVKMVRRAPAWGREWSRPLAAT